MAKTGTKKKAKTKAITKSKGNGKQTKETALAVVDTKAPVEGAMNLQAYAHNQKVLAKFVKTYLKKGDNAKGDYGFIVTKEGKKVSDQPVLFKRGAEKLAELYRLGARLKCTKDDENFGHEKAGMLFMSYTYRCDIFRLDNPQTIIAQCEGSANSGEKSCREYDKPQPANSIRKRAQKRAYVGAIVMATRSSQWFTQDLEDGDPNTPNIQSSAKPEGRKRKEARLHILAGEVGESKAETEAYLKDTYGNKSATKLKLEELEGEIAKLAIARTIVGIAKAQGYKIDEIRAQLKKKYNFRSWFDTPVANLKELLKKAREATSKRGS